MTTTDIAIIEDRPLASSLALVAPAAEFAERICRTNFTPSAFRGKPDELLACLIQGDELGLGPMASMRTIHIVEGKPALAAEAMRALVLGAGHEIWTEEGTNRSAKVGGRRRGSERDVYVEFTMDDAKRAGLDGRPNWRKYPRAMLVARATAALARELFADVLAGVSYSVEELSDGEFADPEIVSPELEVGDRPADAPPAPTKKAAATRKATGGTKKKKAPATKAPATKPAPSTAGPALPGEDGYEDSLDPTPTPTPADEVIDAELVPPIVDAPRAEGDEGDEGDGFTKADQTLDNQPTRAVGSPEVEDAELVPEPVPEPDEDQADADRKRRHKRIMALARDAWPDLDQADRSTARHLFTLGITARVASANDLDAEEQAKLIDWLKQVVDGTVGTELVEAGLAVRFGDPERGDRVVTFARLAELEDGAAEEGNR